MGVPNVGKTDSFAGYSCVVPDAGSIANLLNQYFCTYTGPVEVSELHMVTDQWPHGSASPMPTCSIWDASTMNPTTPSSAAIPTFPAL